MIAAASLEATATDALVVGAGPAGATAARTLARAGVRVRLLDRSAFPRNKPCGGGISVRVLKRFPYLERELSRISTHALSRLYLEGPDGDGALIESDGPAALMIRRIEFDELLVSLAVDAGAVLETADIAQAREDADRVVLTSRDGRQFAAPMVIAADGVHSGVARRLGINAGWPSTAVALDMMEETPRETLRDVDPSTLWVAYGYSGKPQTSDVRRQTSSRSRSVPEGYAYIFPKRDHVNIGIGYVLSYYRESVDEAPYELQRGFVDRLRERGVVVGDSVRRNFTPFLIPVGGPLREPGRGRVLLAGDAGGFVNGFTAEGIYYAMVSGDLAAKTIIDSASPVSLARRYAAACDYEIGAELRDSVAIQRYLFGDRRRIGRIIRGANRERAATQPILDFARGLCSYAQVRRRILARSPLVAARLIWELMTKMGSKKDLSAASSVT
ncbi:MAG TPA: geranylgeranyl reductase family protein [Vicinamibacterales bacterium]|nr:geranylgeranyl reductase family protein [Vicinamibacterales bacterium]